MHSASALLKFLVRAIVIGLAVAFLAVWWKPALLRAWCRRPARAPRHPVRRRGARAGPAGRPRADARARRRPSSRGSARRRGARSSRSRLNIYTARVVTEKTPAAPLDQLFGDYWPSYRQRIERSLGSGVIVDDKGRIVTNQHVINGADSIKVQMSDGRVADATIVGQDPDTDIAILDVKTGGRLPVMPLGRSDTLRAATSCWR